MRVYQSILRESIAPADMSLPGIPYDTSSPSCPFQNSHCQYPVDAASGLSHMPQLGIEQGLPLVSDHRHQAFAFRIGWEIEKERGSVEISDLGYCAEDIA